MYHVSFDIDFKHNTFPGTFIALEGIDGSGKTTQVHQLKTFFEEKGYTVFITKNPTNRIIGKLIREILDGKVKLSPVSFQYLYSADRQLQQEELIPHLEKGEIVITDRYFWSAIAYGLTDKAGKYSNEDMFMAAHSIMSMYNQHMLPDYTFYLDISITTAFDRLMAMHKKGDIYEKKYKLEKVVHEYKRLRDKFPHEIIKINAEQSVETVTKDMLAMIQLIKQ